LPDFAAWTEFCDINLKEYLREHLPADMSSTRNHSMSDLSANLNIAVDEIMDIGPNEFEACNKSDASRSPTAQLIEGLQKLNDPQSLKNFFEQARHQHHHRDENEEEEEDKEKSDEDEEDIFDILARRSNKASDKITDKMDVDEWPTTSSNNKISHNDDDDENEELELFKKLKPIEGATSSSSSTSSKQPILFDDDDWPVTTTMPPPTPNEDEWDTFTCQPAEDFPKEKSET